MNLKEKLISLFPTNKPKLMVLKGQIVLKAGVMNANNIHYSQDCINQMHEQIQNKIKDGGFFGEIFRPTQDFGAISLSNASHMITNSKVDGDLLKIDLKILATPAGEKLKSIIEDSVFRPRGVGHVSAAGNVTNYRVTSINAVPKATDPYFNLI